MLKSLSTQFAATLFLGPLGLIYSSVAAAVFFTLLFAVLLFSELGVYSVLIVWPVTTLTGMLFVKLHNDSVVRSGKRLLLGPRESAGLVSTIGSWARGISALAVIAVGGYFAYQYLPAMQDNKLGRIVGVTATQSRDTTSRGQDNVAASPGNNTTASTRDGESSEENTNDSDNFVVVEVPKREVKPVVIGANSKTGLPSARSGAVTNQATLYVQAAVVNLRQGPGTEFSIITQVERGERLVEFARDGQWVNVETATTGSTGWIYGQLVKPVSP